MTVYPRRRVHIVPGHPRRLRRATKPKQQKKEPPMQMIVARMTCGRTKYEARLPLPVGATRDPAALRSLKMQLRLMLAEQIVKGSDVKFTRETLANGALSSP